MSALDGGPAADGEPGMLPVSRAETSTAADDEQAKAAAGGQPGARNKRGRQPAQPGQQQAENEAMRRDAHSGRRRRRGACEEQVGQASPVRSLAEVQAGMLQELPAPMRGVACDLPPAAPELAVRPAEALTSQALMALAQQDAALYDQHLRLMRFDDALAELASRRGLLVRFHIKSIRAYRAEPALVVEAPEGMTVEYLKRRVVKAKLQRGDKLLNTARFLLRKPVGGGEGGTDARSFEELPATTPAGDEVFLFHVGYRAPGPYELYITTAPQANDCEQQEAMVASLMGHAQEQQRQRQAAAALAAAASMTTQSAEVVDARLSFQALLNAPPGLPAEQDGPNSCSPRAAQVQLSVARTKHLVAVQAAQTAAAAASRAAAAAITRTDPGTNEKRGRRQLGRWTADEVAQLIAAVQEHGTHWAAIVEGYVRTSRINPSRTPVDLKDKWRNLVRLACDPGRQARSLGLDEEQRQIVWNLVFSSNGAVDAPAVNEAASGDATRGSGE